VRERGRNGRDESGRSRPIKSLIGAPISGVYNSPGVFEFLEFLERENVFAFFIPPRERENPPRYTSCKSVNSTFQTSSALRTGPSVCININFNTRSARRERTSGARFTKERRRAAFG
jgi:hypothetical protein